MIIDAHTHIFPDALAPRAMEVLVGNSGTTPFTDGTCAGLRKSMRNGGVDISVVAPIATKPSQTRGINKWAVELCKSDDLISLGTLHPMQENWQSEIDKLVANGIRGIKLHPDYQEFFVDEPEYVPVFRALADAKLIVLFHAGVDIGLPPPVHCTPDRLARLLDAVPDLTTIAAHMGGYKCWDEVERYLVGRNLYFDTSYSISGLGADRMAAIIKAHGPGRILFGTDSPWTDPASEIPAIRMLDLPHDDVEAILGGNAARLLGVS